MAKTIRIPKPVWYITSSPGDLEYTVWKLPPPAPTETQNMETLESRYGHARPAGSEKSPLDLHLPHPAPTEHQYNSLLSVRTQPESF